MRMEFKPEDNGESGRLKEEFLNFFIKNIFFYFPSQRWILLAVITMGTALAIKIYIFYFHPRRDYDGHSTRYKNIYIFYFHPRRDYDGHSTSLILSFSIFALSRVVHASLVRKRNEGQWGTRVARCRLGAKLPWRDDAKRRRMGRGGRSFSLTRRRMGRGGRSPR